MALVSGKDGLPSRVSQPVFAQAQSESVPKSSPAQIPRIPPSSEIAPSLRVWSCPAPVDADARMQVNLEGANLGQERNQMLKGPAEPIHGPRHDHLELAFGGIPAKERQTEGACPCLSQPIRAATSRSSRSWFAVVCSLVLTRRYRAARRIGVTLR